MIKHWLQKVSLPLVKKRTLECLFDIKTVLMVLLTFVAMSCGDNTDDKIPDDPEDISHKFVGSWYNGLSYGGVIYTFSADGKATCRVIGASGFVGTWKYVKETKMLITTLHNGFDNWQIVDVDDMRWTGQFQNSTNPMITYERIDHVDNSTTNQSGWYPSSMAHRLIYFNEYDSFGNSVKKEPTKLHFVTDKYFYTNLSWGLGYYSSNKRNSNPNTGYLTFSLHSEYVPSEKDPRFEYKMDVEFKSFTTFIYKGIKIINKGVEKDTINIHGEGGYASSLN